MSLRHPFLSFALLGLLFACSDNSDAVDGNTDDLSPSNSAGGGGAPDDGMEMDDDGPAMGGGGSSNGGSSTGGSAGEASLGGGGAGGAADPAAGFPDDGLERDRTYSAGDIPLPASTMEFPELLSQTGLYADAAKEVFAYDVRLFKPQFQLWSDTAEKRRWFYLPAGEQIDTSDMDNWKYPVGTKLWKEFKRGDVRVETRIIWRIREGGRGWISMAYIWNDEQTDAVAAPLGMENAAGTMHDVPGSQACNDCHAERADRPLGVSAVQLSHDGPGLNLTDLIERKLLTDPPAGDFVLPGTPVEQAALGYLHGNCGHCHRSESSAALRGDLRMWLLVDQLADLKTTDTFTYLVGQEVFAGTSQNTIRIVPGSPEQSEVVRRMELRETEGQMPPLGTEDADPTGLGAVKAWIEALAAQ